MSLINAFNNTLDDFLADLLCVFPNEQYLKTYYNAFQLLRKANPKQIITEFKVFVEPYSQQIKDCDTAFFLEINNLNLDDSYLNKGIRLRELWLHPETTDHTKACIISYMQKLLKISERIN